MRCYLLRCQVLYDSAARFGEVKITRDLQYNLLNTTKESFDGGNRYNVSTIE